MKLGLSLYKQWPYYKQLVWQTRSPLRVEFGGLKRTILGSASAPFDAKLKVCAEGMDSKEQSPYVLSLGTQKNSTRPCFGSPEFSNMPSPHWGL